MYRDKISLATVALLLYGNIDSLNATHTRPQINSESSEQNRAPVRRSILTEGLWRVLGMSDVYQGRIPPPAPRKAEDGNIMFSTPAFKGWNELISINRA